jgi:hypothetical protein
MSSQTRAAIEKMPMNRRIDATGKPRLQSGVESRSSVEKMSSLVAKK